MQIDLIGCTSAGKSSLTRSILQACHEQGIDISMADDFVLKQVGLNWVKVNPARRLLVNVIALVACLVTWHSNREFYLFVTQLLFKLPIVPLERLYVLRNVLKKIGIHEIIRYSRTGHKVILVDEGVLQAAHNLFVHVSVEVKTEYLSTFAGLVPLPDVVVYLRQPEELLVDRTMKRGHKRIPDRSYRKVIRFIKQAVATFDRLVQHPAVKSRLLIIDGDQHVNVAANDHGDPVLDLAFHIIRNGLTGDTTHSSTETTFAPTSPNSLPEKVS